MNGRTTTGSMAFDWNRKRRDCDSDSKEILININLSSLFLFISESARCNHCFNSKLKFSSSELSFRFVMNGEWQPADGWDTKTHHVSSQKHPWLWHWLLISLNFSCFSCLFIPILEQRRVGRCYLMEI